MKLNYISLFSSAGIGCYGFKEEGYECIATVEIIKRRLEIQKINNKCKYNSGYICGDIRDYLIKQKIFNEIEKSSKKTIDVLIATPPCQGMSTANSKKNKNDIIRNSLVIESIDIVDKIKPNFFIFENVPAFMNTTCIDSSNKKYKIGNYIYERLNKDYSIYHDVINFKDYGVPSSRKRCLVIGVKNTLSKYISPLELFPDKERNISIKESIYNLKRLKKMGEISDDDIFHFFREYDKKMIPWIQHTKAGQSAFDNELDIHKPHKVNENGEIIINKNKMGGKYKRQLWDQVAPCIHTRNDALASQNTIHPEDDRVFSIRELMIFMTVPKSFRWSEISESELNKMSLDDKKLFLKRNEINIRQVIGEAVPTLIFKSIAKKIKKKISSNNINKIKNISILEKANPKREENEAFYTDKFLVNEILKNIPNFDDKDELTILEPSVGLGSFLPLLFKKYENKKKVEIDVVDIDKETIVNLKKIFTNKNLPKNVKINYYCDDFLKIDVKKRYDLTIGNPPFKKMDSKTLKNFKNKYKNINSNNIISYFLLKSVEISDYVSLVLPKNFLIAPNYNDVRDFLYELTVDSIIDFDNLGFDDVLMETINICINTNLSNDINYDISILNLKTNKKIIQKKNYIFDKMFPNWIIYRNDIFDNIYNKLFLDIFSVSRDRQITNSYLTSKTDKNSIRVLRSRNIDKNGRIVSISDYDRYLRNDIEKEKLTFLKYLNDVDALICPNFTTNIRVAKKPKNTLVNGSLAILKNKTNKKITNSDINWFSSDEFIEFYKISNNYQKNTLNLDKNAIFYFGIRKEN